MAGAAWISWKEKKHAPGKGPIVDGVKKRGVGIFVSSRLAR